MMTYQTTITKKGQVTIPKKIREVLRLNRFRKIFVELAGNGKEIRMKPAQDFLEVAKKINVRQKINPVKARQTLQRSYERL